MTNTDRASGSQAERIMHGLSVLEQQQAPLSASVLPLCPPPPISFPLLLSYLRVLKNSTTLNWSEQQDAPLEIALDVSLNYIYKVSYTPISARHPDLLSSCIIGTVPATRTDAVEGSQPPMPGPAP